jgi:hypothetical protein
MREEEGGGKRWRKDKKQIRSRRKFIYTSQ